MGAIWAFFYLPETKGVPLEEIAALFGDTEEIMVFSEDIHVDLATDHLVVERHGQSGVTRVATEIRKSGIGDIEAAQHIEEPNVAVSVKTSDK